MNHFSFALRACAALVAFALLACASPIKTGYNATPGTDFASFRTYEWVTEDLMAAGDATASDYISPIDDARIRRIVEQKMGEKGLTKAPHDQADLVLAFTVKREEKIQQDIDPGTLVYYPSAYGPYNYGYGGMAVSYEQYTEGSLAFHFFDRRTRELVWTGFASKRLSKDHEPPEVVELIVEHIMLKYPPPAS